MRAEERTRLEERLRQIPAGEVRVEYAGGPRPAEGLLAEAFQARTDGRGLLEAYGVLPGVEAAFDTFQAPSVTVRHPARADTLELFYCRSGRVGWTMAGGTAVYLGAGDMTVHRADRCADSSMLFPLGYAEGLVLWIHPGRLARALPELLRQAGVDPLRLGESLSSGETTAIPAGPELDGIFAPLYAAPPARRLPWLRLKAQELLLYLHDFRPDRRALTPYEARQTEVIREVHSLLTEHLEQRFTIEELARRCLLNTSTLKEVFKAVYGLPIATYMKEYRVRQAMKLLRDTDESVASVAARVGYETQGKFAKAFRDVAGVLPTEYRRQSRER